MEALQPELYRDGRGLQSCMCPAKRTTEALPDLCFDAMLLSESVASGKLVSSILRVLSSASLERLSRCCSRNLSFQAYDAKAFSNSQMEQV